MDILYIKHLLILLFLSHHIFYRIYIFLLFMHYFPRAIIGLNFQQLNSNLIHNHWPHIFKSSTQIWPHGVYHYQPIQRQSIPFHSKMAHFPSLTCFTTTKSNMTKQFIPIEQLFFFLFFFTAPIEQLCHKEEVEMEKTKGINLTFDKEEGKVSWRLGCLHLCTNMILLPRSRDPLFVRSWCNN